MFRHIFRRRLSEAERLRLYVDAAHIAQQRLAAVEEPPAKRRAPEPVIRRRGLAAIIPGAVPFRPFTLTPPSIS